MSHYIIMVALSGNIVEENLKEELKRTLAPYEEQTKDHRYRQFIDKTDEGLASYQTDNITVVKVEGQVLFSYEARFQNPDYYKSVGGDKKERYIYPEGVTPYEIPVREFYTFSQYMTDYHGYKLESSGYPADGTSQRFGYWANPNAKWDWYLIGGRWTGYFPVKQQGQGLVGEPGLMTEPSKPGKADIVRKRDIDLDVLAIEAEMRLTKFYDEYQRFIAGEEFRAFEGPRELAVDLGLVTVKKERPPEEEIARAFPWGRNRSYGDERDNYWDVWTPITREEVQARFADVFNPINPYGYLDQTGWHEPGRMGWFGVSHDTPEDFQANKRAFTQWFKALPDDTWLIAVDCHI